MSLPAKIAFFALLSPCGFPTIAAEAPMLCDAAAIRAAEETGVPAEILMVLARTESGRRDPATGTLVPWPWTTNEGGAGSWFPSVSEAVAHARSRAAEGVTNLDVGCFQLNLRWHAEAFASMEAMFDPLTNARYAADYLAQQYARTGDWSEAAGAYHSGTPEYAEKYRARFEQIAAQIGGETFLAATNAAADLPIEAQVREARVNTFPLLIADGSGRGGSLVPLRAGATPLIAAP